MKKKKSFFTPLATIALIAIFISTPYTLKAEEANTPTATESPQNSPENATKQPETSPIPTESISETNAPNKALEVLKDRQDKIQETFQKSEAEKKTENAQSELEKVQLEKQTLESLNATIRNEVSELQNKIKEQENLQKSLEAEQQKNKENTQKLNSLESSQSKLEKELETKNLLLKKNKETLENLAQEEELKKYALQQNIALQKALQEKNNEEIQSKIYFFIGVTGLFIILYLARVLLSKKIFTTKKSKQIHGHKFVAFDIISLISYIGFIAWFIFYLRPEMVVYLLFLVGAIVIVVQEYIFSIISSVFIVQAYKVGERIRYKGDEGIIENINLLKVFVRTIDSQGTNMQEVRAIPNSQFMKNEVTILTRNSIEKAFFKIILPNDLSIQLPKFVKHIEENILQKFITVKSNNEITDNEYFYELDFSFMRTGQPAIEISWQETRGKSIRIKRKILAELETFKKRSQNLKPITDEIE